MSVKGYLILDDLMIFFNVGSIIIEVFVEYFFKFIFKLFVIKGCGLIDKVKKLLYFFILDDYKFLNNVRSLL